PHPSLPSRSRKQESSMILRRVSRWRRRGVASRGGFPFVGGCEAGPWPCPARRATWDAGVDRGALLVAVLAAPGAAQPPRVAPVLRALAGRSTGRIWR